MAHTPPLSMLLPPPLSSQVVLSLLHCAPAHADPLPPPPQVVLSMLHSRLGNRWSDIVATQCLPGRSQNYIKNKW